VHGVAGSGKSSALTSAAEDLWQKCDLQEDGALVPIFVSLPALRDPVAMAVEETLEAWGFSRRNIEELLRSKYRFVIRSAWRSGRPPRRPTTDLAVVGRLPSSTSLATSHIL